MSVFCSKGCFVVGLLVSRFWILDFSLLFWRLGPRFLSLVDYYLNFNFVVLDGRL